MYTENPFKLPSVETAIVQKQGCSVLPKSNPHPSRLHPVELGVGETIKVLLDGHEQSWGSPETPKPRREGHTGDVSLGGGVWGRYGSEQAGVVEAPDSRVAVLAH